MKERQKIAGSLAANTYGKLMYWLGEWSLRQMLQGEITKLIRESRDHPKQLEEAFQRGFTHGQNKTVPILKRLERTQSQCDRWRLKYKGEVPSLKAYIQELRKHVTPEQWREVMETKRPPKPNARPEPRTGEHELPLEGLG